MRIIAFLFSVTDFDFGGVYEFCECDGDDW